MIHLMIIIFWTAIPMSIVFSIFSPLCLESELAKTLNRCSMSILKVGLLAMIVTNTAYVISKEPLFLEPESSFFPFILLLFYSILLGLSVFITKKYLNRWF